MPRSPRPPLSDRAGAGGHDDLVMVCKIPSRPGLPLEFPRARSADDPRARRLRAGLRGALRGLRLAGAALVPDDFPGSRVLLGKPGRDLDRPALADAGGGRGRDARARPLPRRGAHEVRPRRERVARALARAGARHAPVRSSSSRPPRTSCSGTGLAAFDPARRDPVLDRSGRSSATSCGTSGSRARSARR